MSAVLDAPTEILSPHAGESYANFVRRAHYALLEQVPDWEDRNQKIWDAWEQVNGDPLRERAQKYFASHRFVPSVCYFSEHETIGRDGKPVRYSFNELSQIVDEHNRRADRHNYAALVERHTQDGPNRHQNEPRVVGFVGAARLGMVGNQDPHWGAFFDEHHKGDTYSQNILADKQRRSVEVNRYRDGRPPYFDPVAVLGADSPRLPLPVARYSHDSGYDSDEPSGSPDEVDRYSVVAPAMVSGTNSFIPNYGSGSKKQEHQYSEQSAMTDQDIQAIVQAIMSTPQMQWVNEQMGGGGAPEPQQQPGGMLDDAGAQAASGMPGGQMPPQSGPPVAPQPGEQQYMGGKPNLSLPRYSNPDNEDSDLDTERYSQLAHENEELRDKYSQLAEVNQKLMQDHAQVRKAVINLERAHCDKDRELQLRELHQKYSHFIDLDEELDRCLYSRESQMSPSQFDEHVESLERYAARSNPVTRMIPNGNAPSGTLDKDNYEAQVADMVVDRYTRYASKGEIKTYEDIEREVREELG